MKLKRSFFASKPKLCGLVLSFALLFQLSPAWSYDERAWMSSELGQILAAEMQQTRTLYGYACPGREGCTFSPLPFVTAEQTVSFIEKIKDKIAKDMEAKLKHLSDERAQFVSSYERRMQKQHGDVANVLLQDREFRNQLIEALKADLRGSPR